MSRTRCLRSASYAHKSCGACIGFGRAQSIHSHRMIFIGFLIKQVVTMSRSRLRLNRFSGFLARASHARNSLAQSVPKEAPKNRRNCVASAELCGYWRPLMKSRKNNRISVLEKLLRPSSHRRLTTDDRSSSEPIDPRTQRNALLISPQFRTEQGFPSFTQTPKWIHRL